MLQEYVLLAAASASEKLFLEHRPNLGSKSHRSWFTFFPLLMYRYKEFNPTIFYHHRKSGWRAEYVIQDANQQTVLKIRGPCCPCQTVCCTDDVDFAVSSDVESIRGNLWTGTTHMYMYNCLRTWLNC